MKKTKIEWCDSTWNPVTGCYHGCEYCYARRIAERFGGFDCGATANCNVSDGGKAIFSISEPMRRNGKAAPYPWGFAPTLHRYKLDEPKRWTKGRNIFVCSMADLFGAWVPDSWIDEVIRATQTAKQHKYLFLTKNPERYGEWLGRFEESGIDNFPDEIENCWFGASASNNAELEKANSSQAIWLSIEPIRERIYTDEDQFMEFLPPDGLERRRWEWVVIGAETGNQKNKIIPEKAWIDEIVEVCDFYKTPVFMKNSLIPIVGEKNMRREFPWQD